MCKDAKGEGARIKMKIIDLEQGDDKVLASSNQMGVWRHDLRVLFQVVRALIRIFT